MNCQTRFLGFLFLTSKLGALGEWYKPSALRFASTENRSVAQNGR